MSGSSKFSSGRRKFLAGSAAAATLATTGMMTARASAASGISWSKEADVICVGSGVAACSAAVTAANLGNNVILLEKSVIFGGTTRRSGGVAWIPNNFSLRENGVEDDERDCIAYMTRYAYPDRFDPESETFGLGEHEYSLLEAFYRNGFKAVDTFQKIGASNFIRFELPGGVGPSADYAPSLPENKTPKGRSIWPDPSISGGRGSALVDGMIKWLSQNGAETLTGHSVVNLVMEGDRVVGVTVETDSELLNIRAKKGVIFGTGGYAHNEDMVHRYQLPLYGACAAGGSTGDFMTMASGIGARIGNMCTAWRSQVVLQQAMQNRQVGAAVNIPPADSMIFVNKYGKRVVNEKRNYNDRTKVQLIWDPVKVEYPNQLLYMIFDQRALDVFGGNFPIPQNLDEADYVIQGDSLKELEENLQEEVTRVVGANPTLELAPEFSKTLSETIEKYSQYAREGQDPEFLRGADKAEIEWQAYFSRPQKGKEAATEEMPNPTMYPISESGPYYAVIIAPGALDTNSGPVVNSNAQVLSAEGRPIPGLYGAGNCIASPSRAPSGRIVGTT